MFAAVRENSSHRPKTYHADNAKHFNQRELEFRSLIQTNVHQIYGINDNKTTAHTRKVRQAASTAYRCPPRSAPPSRPASTNMTHTVPAARQKPANGPQYFQRSGQTIRKTGSSTTTQLAHTRKSDNPGNAIAQQNSRPRHLNRRADARETVR